MLKNLRSLTKRDATTKLKALRALKTYFSEASADVCAEALPSCLFYFRTVMLDNNRSVRLDATQLLSVLVTQAGRNVAPHLKDLMGPWYLAMCDPYSEAASAAQRAFEVCVCSCASRSPSCNLQQNMRAV